MAERDIDDDDRPRRRRRDEDDDDRPRRRRDEDDDDDDRPRRAKKGGMGLWLILGIVAGVLLLCIALPVVLLIPAVSKVREAAGRAKDGNNLKVIGIAALNTEATTGEISTGPYLKDPSTRQVNTGLSYRVALLPYIEQQALYMQFKADEPWDSAANRRLADTVVAGYTSPLDPPASAKTRYRVFVGKGTMFEPGVPVRLSGVQDGTSNTILFVTADDAVTWSQPDELPFSPTGPPPVVGKKAFPGGTNVLMADGSIRFLKASTPPDVLKALITRNGGETLPFDW